MSLLSPVKLLLHTEKTNFLSWEKILGSLELSSLEEVKANSISINLIGIRKYSTFQFSQSRVQQDTSTHIIHSQPITLAWPGTYMPQVFSFEYIIPENIIPKQFAWFGKIGNLPEWAVNIINILMSILKLRQPQFTLEFFLQWTIDIPWWIDVVERMYISIAPQNPWDLQIDIPNFGPWTSKNEDAQTINSSWIWTPKENKAP